MSSQSNSNLKQSIQKIVIEDGRPIPKAILISKVCRSNRSVQRKEIENTIDEMIKSGNLRILSKSGKIQLGYEDAPVDTSKTYEGVIRINSKGSGFIRLDNEEKSKYFVYRTNLNQALDGDRVEFALLKKAPKKDLLDAVVLKIISHGKDFYTGLININKDGTYKVTIDDEKMYLPVKLDSLQGLVDGQKVLIKIKTYEKDAAYGTVSKIIGHSSDVGVDILSIVYDNGVEPNFTPDVLDYARKIELNIDDYQRKIRKDLTNLPIVTIDPATSKDFDDAIYVKKNNDDEYYLCVCIADVSHYVRYKSPLDETAYKRGCSIYLVDRVIPMLPHNLSDDICSLNPNVERLTLTCDMLINKSGKIKSIKVYPSIIKSHRRFSYDEVNDFFNNKSSLEKDTNEVKAMLKDALELHRILDAEKKRRGYIAFEIPEPIIKLDDKGFPIDILTRKLGTAQNMIENFMVAANEAVTIYANQKKWPFVYRIHEKPNEEKLKTFSIEAKKLNFRITTDIEDIESIDIAKWIEDNKDNKNMDLINLMLLRSMAKAKYSIENLGHFGLSLENYTHFTSPIRRYPDLLVHRIFWMYEFEKNNTTDSNRNHFAEQLDDCCKQSSDCEKVAISCENDVNAMKFAEYMTKHIGEKFEGFVSAVSAFGLFVELPNTIEGLIKLPNLKTDFYSYDEKTNQLIGKKTGTRFSLGSKVRVRVISADKQTRKIEFELVKFLGNR